MKYNKNKDGVNNTYKNSKLPLVSIVVVNYNGIEHLETCLKSISMTNYPNFEILFIDNASSDDSVNYVIENFSHIKIIQNKYNLGATGGYNTGIINARGKYVAILNNDIEVSYNWLTPIIEIMQKDNSIAAADSKYLNFFDRERFDNVAAAGRYIDLEGTVYARGANEYDNGQYNEIKQIFAALTLFRRSIFSEIGLFDEDFFYGYDEIDLAWRINLRGYKVVYVPSSKIYHKVSKTSTIGTKLKPGFYFLIKRNKLQMLIKNLPKKFLIPALTISLLEYLFYILYWLYKKNIQYFIELISAIMWNLKNFQKILLKRKMIKKIKIINEKKICKLILPYQGDILKFIARASI